MEKILTQEEIDALFRATQKGQIPGGPAQPTQRKISKLNLRAISQINKDQVRALSALHESFARNVTNSLGAYLRVGFAVNLVSVEQLTFSEVLSRLPDLTYLCSIRMQPIEANALLQMDLAIAFPIMDLVLGGAGGATSELRDLTEIEEEIIQSVMEILTRELQNAWAPVLEVQIDFDQRLKNNQAMSLMATTERSLALSFEITMPEVRGILNVTLPAVASNALLRKLSAQTAYSRHGISATHGNQLRAQALDSEFAAELRLPPALVSVRELTDLQVGNVLRLFQPVNEPAILYIGQKEMFTAYPVACGRLRGGQILQRKSILPVSRKAAP
ncbi:MAG: FliM/FliN family flagellar motor switch protein [Acidobacteriia bacterium]|nr:FliM/FliN family flagellar motor switch protein [Terriglobia bacterium]